MTATNGVSVKTVYCLKHKDLGFLCDSEWDGDSFTKDPIHAYHYDAPTEGGRGPSTYTCVPIKIISATREEHMFTDITMVVTHKRGLRQNRFKAKCSWCGISTKNLCDPALVVDRIKDLEKKPCTKVSWGYV